MKHVVTMVRLFFLALFAFLLANGRMTLWLGLFAVSLLAAPAFGRIFCGYICPMNTVMIPAEWISKKLKLQTQKTPQWLGNGYFSWIALIASIAAMLLSKRFLHINLPVLPIWLAIAVLVTLRYRPAVFHNLLCPFGAPQKLFGRFAKRAKKVEASTCIGCKLCEKVCPSDAIAVIEEEQKAVINTALCHQCINCQQVCPKESIGYSPMISRGYAKPS
ncbi:MAG: 4Fe-4S binding protein [Clostridia bacterium]|jgi:polyferredoxin|nr:4Fe-4S binding protein [Clostridia bacterium]